jgi:hypothetical protein
MATKRQIVAQTQFDGYDIDVFRMTYANGYVCYEYVISDEVGKLTESEEGYIHPDDALDDAVFFLDGDYDGESVRQQHSRIKADALPDMTVIGVEQFIVTISADEIRIAKQGAEERVLRRQDLVPNDLMSLQHDPMGTVICWYERGE